MLEFVLAEHFRLAIHAALLFAVGLFVSWPVVHYRLDALAALPLAVFRAVLRLMGPSPGIARMTAVIFGFNGIAIFIYMASGLHPLLPKLFAVWTGMNVGLVVGMGREEALVEQARPRAGQWVPAARLTRLCGLLVLLLEMPSFWFSLAMGMSMGHAVRAGAAYADALGERAAAYAAIILPALLASALAESVTVRGSGAAEGQEPLT